MTLLLFTALGVGSALQLGAEGLLLFLHLCAVNVLVGAAFHVAIAGPAERSLQRRLFSALPGAFSLTLILGVGSLLFLQEVHGERFLLAGELIPGAWMVGIAALLTAWLSSILGWRATRGQTGAPRLLRMLPLLGMLVFAYVLITTISLGEKHAVMAQVAAGETQQTWTSLGTAQRWFHELVGAIALGSLYLLWLAWQRRAEDSLDAELWARRAIRTAFVATGVGALAGVCTLLKAPAEVGGPLAGICLTVGIIAGLAVPFHMKMAWTRSKPRMLVVAAGLVGLCLLAKGGGLRLAVRAKRLAQAPELQSSSELGTPVLLGSVAGLVALLLLLSWVLRLRGAHGGASN